MIDIKNPPRYITIGRKEENEYRKIEFNCKSWLDENPGASITVVFSRPDRTAYPVVTAATTNIVTWTVTARDTLYDGEGELELRLIKGSTIGKSPPIAVQVLGSITGVVPAPTPPTPDWISVAAMLQNTIGALTNLSTDNKSSAVAAINEIAQRGGSFNLHALTEGAIGDSDELLFYSISENDKRKFTLTALKSKLKAYFDTIYLSSHQSLLGYATETWVTNKNYLTSHQSLAAYRTSAAQALIDATKQNATDNSLNTEAKTVIGAINELYSTLSTIEDALDTIIELLTDDDEEDTT